ncbi:hypothetical protein [Indioceanicola profundi]|uniref:hypothetical protein n=1 Tax=Indioceanicola profundi TaxID=2220096 RepID=UPI000E6AD306|nr:hypothetical protein [Indioceanicola profundi]
MKMERRQGTLAALMLAATLLQACAAQLQPAREAAAAGSPAPINPDTRLGELPPQRLAAGQCGLFLWGRTVPARLVLFGAGRDGGARIAMDGRIVDLLRASAEGDPVFGQFPRQTFKGEGAEIGLTLEFERRPDLVGGALVPRGVLDLRDADGWSHVMPVAGLIGCEPG